MAAMRKLSLTLDPMGISYFHLLFRNQNWTTIMMKNKQTIIKQCVKPLFTFNFDSATLSQVSSHRLLGASDFCLPCLFAFAVTWFLSSINNYKKSLKSPSQSFGPNFVTMVHGWSSNKIASSIPAFLPGWPL